MNQKPRKRIATSGPDSPLVGVDAAFSGVNLPDLPPGPAPAPDDAAPSSPLWKMGRVILRREKASRGGKTVIVIHDFATHLPDSVIEDVARKLRSSCGCGGAVKKRTIEIQGDQPENIRKLLLREGFTVAGVT